jgi:hypothetical protein
MKKPANHAYTGTEALDHLARINVELLSELWIMRDRMAVMEKLLVEKGVLTESEIDDFNPDAAFAARLERLRDLVVGNVIGAPYRHELTVDELKARARAFADTRKT